MCIVSLIFLSSVTLLWRDCFGSIIIWCHIAEGVIRVRVRDAFCEGSRIALSIYYCYSGGVRELYSDSTDGVVYLPRFPLTIFRDICSI